LAKLNQIASLPMSLIDRKHRACCKADRDLPFAWLSAFAPVHAVFYGHNNG